MPLQRHDGPSAAAILSDTAGVTGCETLRGMTTAAVAVERPLDPAVVLLVTAMPPQAGQLAGAVQRLAPQVQFVMGHESPDDAALESVEVLLGWRAPRQLLPKLRRLRWVCSMAAGVEKLLIPELPAALPVSRIVDPDQALGMAQYTAAMVLRHARGLARYDGQQHARDWTRHPMPASHLRVAVLGMGAVGREVARQLASLGFVVTGWRRDGTPLVEVLRDADVVVNVLPLTPQTEGLLDARAFAAMPQGAYVVNVARGGHVVEADLIAAVRSGHLAGAALDVQQREPLPADDPLWDVPGISITPHIASQPSMATVAEQFVAGLRCLQHGQPLPNRVDRGRGY
jgi:glyoxylate/hydroxypyruvate reductase